MTSLKWRIMMSVHPLHDNGVDLMVIRSLCDAFPNRYDDVVEDKMLQNDQRYDRNHWNRQPQGHERDWYLAHDPPTMTALRHFGQNQDPIANEQGYDNFAYDMLNIDNRFLQRYLENPTPQTLQDLHERASWNMTLLDYLHNGTMFPVFNDTHYNHHTDRRDFFTQIQDCLKMKMVGGTYTLMLYMEAIVLSIRNIMILLQERILLSRLQNQGLYQITHKLKEEDSLKVMVIH
jgi:hypothetical protein